MASPRIEYAVLPAGEGPGQDRCFTAEGLVVVLDGASAIDPVANPDATEYVDTLGPLLIEQITRAPGIDLRDALAEAIGQTAEVLAIVPGTAPSSTVSIVRWSDDTVDVLVLGDSPVFVQLADGGQKKIVQHPQEHIATELRQSYRERLAAGYGYDSGHYAALGEIQRREAAARNRSGGYWIAETQVAAAYHSTIRRFSTADTVAAVVSTDGFCDSGRVARALAERRLQPSASTLQARLSSAARWERAIDPRGERRPRSKPIDDKTLAVVYRSDAST